MLAKQYWRIIHNPSSLLAKTFKAEYIPRTTIQDCERKSHHSWIWRNIICQKNSLLGDGRWLFGKGFDIPYNHSSWFHGSPQPPNGGNFYLGTVTDLINNNTKDWKPDLVRQVYPYLTSKEVLKYPPPKTDNGTDRLLWRHSSTGEYQV